MTLGLEPLLIHFKWAADKLRENIQERGFCLNEHLPINFLYRHAIELYLKPGVVIHAAMRFELCGGW
jgi:hypothetical protein